MKKTNYFLIFFILLALALASYFMFFNRPEYSPQIMEEHVRGNHDARIVIVEFSDFQCPYCASVQPTLDQIMEEYPNDVKLIYRHFPLPSHPYAKKAAEASECAAEQGKFWEYHDVLFQNQDNLYTAKLKEYAVDLDLDAEKFNACLDSGVMESRIEQSFQNGIDLGIQGTPTFMINNKVLSGAQSYSTFKAAIEEILRK